MPKEDRTRQQVKRRSAEVSAERFAVSENKEGYRVWRTAALFSAKKARLRVRGDFQKKH